jgi:hypothetical protein
VMLLSWTGKVRLGASVLFLVSGEDFVCKIVGKLFFTVFLFVFFKGCKNAIGLARAVLDYSRVPDRLGRVPPL